MKSTISGTETAIDDGWSFSKTPRNQDTAGFRLAFATAIFGFATAMVGMIAWTIDTKSDIAVLKSENAGQFQILKSDNAVLKSDMKADMAVLKSDSALLKSDMKSDNAGLKSENAGQFQILKSDIAVLIAKLDAKLDGQDRKIDGHDRKIDGHDRKIEGNKPSGWFR